MTRIREVLPDQGLCFASCVLAVSVLQQEGLIASWAAVALITVVKCHRMWIGLPCELAIWLYTMGPRQTWVAYIVHCRGELRGAGFSSSIHLYLMLLHLLKAIIHAARASPLLQRSSTRVVKEKIILLSSFSSFTPEWFTNTDEVWILHYSGFFSSADCSRQILPRVSKGRTVGHLK